MAKQKDEPKTMPIVRLLSLIVCDAKGETWGYAPMVEQVLLQAAADDLREFYLHTIPLEDGLRMWKNCQAKGTSRQVIEAFRVKNLEEITRLLE